MNAECSLCHKQIEHTSCLLTCGHEFCTSCISKWCGKSMNCPACESPFTKLKEVVDGIPTGYFFSAKSLYSLYKSQYEDSEDYIQPAQQLNIVSTSGPVSPQIRPKKPRQKSPKTSPPRPTHFLDCRPHLTLSSLTISKK